MTPEQTSGWLKAGNERRLRALGLRDRLCLHLSCPPEERGALALSHPAPQTPKTTPGTALA